MKHYILSFFLLSGLSHSFLTYSQDNPKPGSLSGNTIYEANQYLPIHSEPAWTEFSVNPEKSTYKIANENLNLKTSDGSVFGYMLSGSSFNPGKTFSFEINGESLSKESGLGVDMRLNQGKRLAVDIKKDAVYDQKTGQKLADIANSQPASYRITVDDNNATLYRDSVFLSTLNIDKDDIIQDPGFETFTNKEASAYWGHDGYTGVSVVSNTKHSGNNSMKWENGWNGRFMGDIKVQPNTSYTFSFWAKLEIVSAWGQTKMNGGLYINGAEISNLSVSGDWKKYTCNFTTGTSTNGVQLYYHNGWTGDGNFTIYFDDFSLEQTSGKPYISFGHLLNTTSPAETNIQSLCFLDGKVLRPVKNTDLNQLISSSKDLIKNAQEGYESGRYPDYAIQRFNQSISFAENIAETENIAYKDLERAYETLQKAYDIFFRSEISNPYIVLSTISLSSDKNPVRANHFAKISVSGKMSDQSDANISIADIHYRSKDESVLTIDTIGKITALKEGTAEVEVSVRLNQTELIKNISIQVIEYVLSSVNIYPYANKIEAGEATGTWMNILMSDGSVPETKDISILYRSLDESIAKINSFGSVIAEKTGKVIIEAEVSVLGKMIKSSCEIEVIALENVSLILSESSVEKGKDITYQAKAMMSDGCILNLSAVNHKVYIENKNIAGIDNTGNISGFSKGETKITGTVIRGNLQKSTTEDLTVTDNSTTLKEAPLHTKAFIYPNPIHSGENARVVFSPDTYENLFLYSSDGKQIFSASINKNDTYIDLTKLRTGLYLIHLYGKKGNCHLKLLVD